MLYRCNFCGNLFCKSTKVSSIFEQVLCKKCLKTLNKKEYTLGIGVSHYKEDSETILNVLRSIDNQKLDFKNIEVAIVTDGDGDIIDEFLFNGLKNIKPICYYHKENTKCGGCRNTLIEKLNTDYILFIDCDDIFAPNTIHKIFNKVLKYKPDIYATTISEEYQDGRRGKLNNVMALNMVHGKFFKRDFLIKNNIKFIEHLHLGEDFRFMLEIYDICDSIIFDTKSIIYMWQYNQNSITRTLGENNNIDVFFRTLESTMVDLNRWFENLDKNKYSNLKLVSYFYNIFYYKIMTANVSDSEKEYYKKIFFSLTTNKNIDFKLMDEIDKKLNRKLMKNIEYFSSAYKKYFKN